MVWFDLIWFGPVRFGLARFGSAWHPYCRTNFCVRKIPYILLAYVLYTIMYFCVRTLAYQHLFTHFCHRTLFPYVLLRTNICVRTFVLRILYPYVLLQTNFWVRTFAYVLLTHVRYPLRIFAYVFFCPPYSSDTHFDPTIILPESEP